MASFTWPPAPTVGASGVSSFNGLTGAITLAAGTNISLSPVGNTITINNTGSGSGTVTTMSVVTANGFSGTVATATTTPAITLNTSFTGIAFSTSGSGMAAAIAANFPTLNQSTTGTAGNITGTTNSTITTLSVLSLPITQVTGIATVAQGGTGLGTLTTGNVILGAGTSNVTFVPATTIGNVLTANGTTWVSQAASTGFTNPMTTAGDIIYGGVGGTATRLATGTGVLVGGATPSYSTTPTLTGTNFTGIPLAGLLASAFNTVPTASTLAEFDANKNISGNNVIPGYTTTATAAGTTTLVVGSTYQQFFTGVTTQTVLLPVTSTLVLGQRFYIENNSTGVVTVQSSGANAIQAMAGSTILELTCILVTGTTAASWDAVYYSHGTVPVVLGGTGLATLTTGNVILGAGTSNPTFVPATTANNVLTAGGATWTSAAPATGSYVNAFFAQASTWSSASTTFADPANTGGNALTVRKSSGITLTAAATSLCGVTWTPANNTAVYFITVSFLTSGLVNSQTAAFQLFDGTTTIATNSVQGNAINGIASTFSGIYAPASASAVTVKLQIANSSASTLNITGNGQTGATTMEWTILRIF